MDTIIEQIKDLVSSDCSGEDAESLAHDIRMILKTETDSGAEYISEAHVRHIMRYVTAASMLRGEAVVIDAACGTGYGTKILSNYCKEITGLDNNERALVQADRVLPNRILKCDLLNPDVRYWANAIVSIETLEHFTQLDGFKVLKTFNDWLDSGGTLIVSTPYCSRSGPSPITKQHLHEYSLTDFEMALAMAGFNVDFIKTTRHEGQAGRLGYCMARATKK